MFPSIIFSWHNHPFIQKYHLCLAGDFIRFWNWHWWQSSFEFPGYAVIKRFKIPLLEWVFHTDTTFKNMTLWFLLLLLFSVSQNTVHYSSLTPTIFLYQLISKAGWIRLPVKPISTCFLISSTDCCWLKWNIFPTEGLSTLPSSGSYLKITLAKDLISYKTWERKQNKPSVFWVWR